MLFLFVLWAYDSDSDDSFSGRFSDSDEILGDAYDDFSSSSEGSRGKKYSTTAKNYAKGKIPSMLHHRLSELFSISNMRRILGVPDILVDLRRWQISSLSAHDVYVRKDHAVHSAIENLCSLLKIKDSSFCDSEHTLLERIVTGTFHNMKSVVLGQLLELVQSTLKEEGKKLTTLKKKIISIKQQAPARKRKLLENKARAREEERKLDKAIKALEKQMSAKQYEDDSDKQYDKEALADLKEQKSLLLIEPEHVHHDLDKQEQVLEKITKQKHLIQSDIKKFKDMSEKLSDIVKERESSSDLEDSWNELNRYSEKLEKAKQDDMRREEEKARELARKKTEENTAEQKEQEKELKMIQGLGAESSDPEASQKSAGWLSSISNLISVGGG